MSTPDDGVAASAAAPSPAAASSPPLALPAPLSRVPVLSATHGALLLSLWGMREGVEALEVRRAGGESIAGGDEVCVPLPIPADARERVLGRSVHCRHAAAFDLGEHHVRFSGESNARWPCPVCGERATPALLCVCTRACSRLGVSCFVFLPSYLWLRVQQYTYARTNDTHTLYIRARKLYTRTHAPRTQTLCKQVIITFASAFPALRR